jgi:hypothetical protein
MRNDVPADTPLQPLAERPARRRRQLAGLVLALVAAVLAGLWWLFPGESAGAALRRVPAGARREAVAEAVGREPDYVVPEKARYEGQGVLVWQFGDEVLRVRFDEGGQVTEVDVCRWRPPTFWARFLGRLGL